MFCFFFSSRRRHTRWNCDWSSDVCSSDLFGTTSARGYTYDQFEPVPGAQPAAEAIMAGDSQPEPDRQPIPVASSQRSARPDGGIALGAGPLTVRLTPHAATEFADQIEALGDERRLYLVISNYKAEA